MLKGDEKNRLCSGIYQEVPVSDSEVSVILPCNPSLTERTEIVALDPSNNGPPTPEGQQEEQTVLPTKIWDLTVSLTFCLMVAKWDFQGHWS